jgi:sulfatase maturation enzyme AslB (radical SAM superfamily)
MTCAAFYNHSNLRNGNRIYPCCRYKTSIQKFDGDVKNILHSNEYKKIRETWTIDDPNCSKCKNEELLGKKSLREWFNENYSTDKIDLKYFEIGFDNICDLTCDGCWEEWSSSWWVKKNPELPPKQGVSSTTELYDIPETIEKIVFLGGEPLMTNRHRRFLESFASLKNLEVEYFTNGMHSLNSTDINILIRCKKVKFTVSVDGFGDLNDQVRSGSKWNTVVDFIKKIPIEFEKVIHTTVHKNNWHGLLDMFSWVHRNEFQWTTNILTYPRELDIVNLDEASKKILINICKFNDIPNRKYIMSHLQGK